MAIIEQTGVLKQVDDEGNVVVLYPAVKTDSTLLESGAPADAAAVGEALKNVKPADSSVTLSQAEYDALSDEEKNNGTTYFISDANGECDATQVSFSSENYSATTVKEAFEEVNSSLNGFSFRKNSEGEKEVSTDGGSTWENFSSGATLLWSNPNPNNTFDAQTIPIDLTGYDYILVTSKGKINSTSETFIKVLCKIGDGGNNFLPSPIQDANYGGYLRDITDITSNGLTFHDCYNRASIDNNGSIPYQIFGIKNFPISI